VPTHGPPVIVAGLIIVNALVFLFHYGLPPDRQMQFLYRYALVPALFGSHRDLAPLLDVNPWLTLITNTFLHGSILHLVVNMWTLWLFGGPLQERLGPGRFLLFYLVCGAVASVAHLVFNLDSRVPALGASGAIAGVLGAYTVLYPKARISFFTLIIFIPLIFALPAVVFAVLWFALQVIQGTASLTGPEGTGGIAWWAHIGGFVTGVVLLRIMTGQGGPPYRPRTVRHRGPRGGSVPPTGPWRGKL